MELTVKIYGCYELTYSRIYKDVLRYFYDRETCENAKLVIEDISEGGKRSVQGQRVQKQYVARTLRICEDGELKHIVGITNTNYDYDKQREKELDPDKKYIFGTDNMHANTYLKQGCANLFNYYYEQKRRNSSVDLSFYLLDLDRTYPHNMFNVLSYRELQTMGFRVLNIRQVDFSQYNKATRSRLNGEVNIRFTSFNKYMNDIAVLSKRNYYNNPSFLTCDERLVKDEKSGERYYVEKYVYTFKSLSAQGYDSLFRILCMKVLADAQNVPIEFRLGKQYFNFGSPVKSVAEKLTKPIEAVFKNAGIAFSYLTNEQFMHERKTAEDVYLSAENNGNPRNQGLFRNNLRRKGVPEKCVICGNDNPAVLKAAHLWEVKDIKKTTEKEIDEFIAVNSLSSMLADGFKFKNALFHKKYCLINSGENGLWLCGNHHDLFDKNYYCFDDGDGTVILHFSDAKQAAAFCDDMVKDCRVPAKVLTRATKAFIAKRRINIGF